MKLFAGIFFLIFFSFFFTQTQAQQKHFVYIESENNQPFAVVLNGKVYSSSDFGYVIVPKLDDGTYNFTISFPLNKFPDQNFKCVVDKKDVGYKLQSNTDKSWTLQNMQTQTAAISGNATAAATNTFSNMLSDVVNDSSLTKKNIPAKQTDTVAATQKKDTVTVATDTSNQSITTTANTLSALQKISESKQDTGTNMVFVDKTSGADTINIFVPSSDLINNTTAAKTSPDTNTFQSQTTATDTLNKNAVTENTSTNITSSSSANPDTSLHAISNPFYKSNNQNNTGTNTTALAANNTSGTSTENTNAAQASAAIKSDCANMVSDNDLDKMKRKMFVQNNDNDIVQTALKYIGNKCITTEQVKILGSLFSSDDGRYSLFDALYKKVYDYGNYVNLESQIIDPYYKRRFEAMLR